MDAPASVILWDFDGTLARRRGGTSFASCIIETLDDHRLGHAITIDCVRPFLQSGFPWHTPEIAHSELTAPEQWWNRVEPLLARAFEGVGFGSEQANRLASLARERYVDPHQWELFDDTVPTLSALRDDGWRHIVLSNHVPELGAIIDHLGLTTFLDATINSAETGYEKPHPEAFAIAKRSAGEAADLWMIGDNPNADVAGATSAGIRAILARTKPGDDIQYHAATLYDVRQILASWSLRRL